MLYMYSDAVNEHTNAMRFWKWNFSIESHTGKEKLNRNEEEILGNNNPQQFTHPVVS